VAFRRPIIYLPIDTATSGDNTLVAGQGGLPIRVLGYVFVCDAAVSVRWRTGSMQGVQVALSGAMSFAANGGASVWGLRDTPVLEVPAGADLVLNLSAAVGVRG
jgi:hypothetical protein